jgi:hypothetical protein
MASPKMPTTSEMVENLGHAFQTISDSSNGRSKLGFQLMVDELKLETHM